MHFFLDKRRKFFILAAVNSEFNSLGEFLNRSSLQLPHPPLTIALVYNLKEEANPAEVRPVDLPTSPSAPVSSLPSVSPSAPGIDPQERTNDVYAEWDTMETIVAVRDALQERHAVELVEADLMAFSRLRDIRPDFVFNVAEGLRGVSREAQMPAIYEMLQLPYLGSDPLTLALCLDKGRTKEILAYHKIPTAQFSVVSTLDGFDDLRVRFPSIVKPVHEGSSKGIYNSCLVRTTEELEREVRTILEVYAQPALVEEFLPGREFTVGILGNGDSLRVLPIVEIKFSALPGEMNPIYSYEAKWILDTAVDPLDIFTCPADIEEGLRQRIEQTCMAAYRVLRCRDWSRIDVRLDASGTPRILEVNPLPGILPKPEDNSCLPKAARAAGLSYSELINTVLDIGLERTGVAQVPTTLATLEIS